MKKLQAKLLRFFLINMKRRSADKKVGQKTSQIPGTGSKHRLIKVVDVEIDKAIITFIPSKVLEVQIATDPDSRCTTHERSRGPILVKEMTGAAEKSKGIVPH